MKISIDLAAGSCQGRPSPNTLSLRDVRLSAEQSMGCVAGRVLEIQPVEPLPGASGRFVFCSVLFPLEGRGGREVCVPMPPLA